MVPGVVYNETFASLSELTPLSPHQNQALELPTWFRLQRASMHYTLFTSASSTSTTMANFAAQLKDRFFGLVDRVAGCGRAGVREEGPQVGAGAGRAGGMFTFYPEGGKTQFDSVFYCTILTELQLCS